MVRYKVGGLRVSGASGAKAQRVDNARHPAGIQTLSSRKYSLESNVSRLKAGGHPLCLLTTESNAMLVVHASILVVSAQMSTIAIIAPFFAVTIRCRRGKRVDRIVKLISGGSIINSFVFFNRYNDALVTHVFLNKDPSTHIFHKSCLLAHFLFLPFPTTDIIVNLVHV